MKFGLKGMREERTGGPERSQVSFNVAGCGLIDLSFGEDILFFFFSGMFKTL